MLLLVSVLVLAKAERDDCDIPDMSKVANAVANMGSPSRTIISLFGYEVSTDAPSLDELTNAPMDYMYSLLGFGAPFLVLLVVYILMFFCHQIFACCCCKPKTSEKPGTSAIVVHLLAAVVVVVSAAMFFYSASSFTNALDTVKGLPNTVKTELGDVFTTVETVVNATFDEVRGVIDSTGDRMTAFMDWLSTENTINQQYCDDVEVSMRQYESVFEDGGGAFQTAYVSVKNCVDESSNNGASTISQQLVAMMSTLSSAVQSVLDVISQLRDASNSIEEEVDNIEDNLNGSIQSIRDSVNEYQNGDALAQLNSMRGTIDDVISKADPIKDLLDQYEPYINAVVYVATVFLVLVGILFGVLFFWNNSCSRCMACVFPLFGLIVTILIVAPGVVFAIAFFVFYDYCPELDKSLSKIVNNAVDLSVSAEELLVCSTPRPLLDMIDLNFDYMTLVDELADSAKQNLDSFQIPASLISNLTGFGEDFDVNTMMKSDYFLLNHSTVLPETREFLTTATCSVENPGTQVTTMETIIAENEPIMTEAGTKIQSILDFGTSILPESEQLKEDINDLVDDFSAEAKELLQAGVDSITCETTKCIYSPVKKAICVEFVDGIAFWIFSMVLMICGLFIMEVSYCVRRKKMKNVQVENGSESEELEEFHGNDKDEITKTNYKEHKQISVDDTMFEMNINDNPSTF